MLFDVGDRIVGGGEVRVDDDGVWLDPAASSGLIRFPQGRSRPRSPCAVRLVDYQPNPNPSAEGQPPEWLWATITGTWTGVAITAVTADPLTTEARHTIPRWTDPPCPAPVGGWPPGTQEDVHRLADPAGLRDDDHMVVRILYRPGPDAVALILAAGDVGAAEKRWRPVLGDRLGVVQSRWSTADLDAVADGLLALARLETHCRPGITLTGRRKPTSTPSYSASHQRWPPGLPAFRTGSWRSGPP